MQRWVSEFSNFEIVLIVMRPNTNDSQHSQEQSERNRPRQQQIP